MGVSVPSACGYPVAMPRPALLSARARSGLAATAVALTVGVTMSACSTSSPGADLPDRHRQRAGHTRAGSTETLLPETDGDAHSAVGELVPEFPDGAHPRAGRRRGAPVVGRARGRHRSDRGQPEPAHGQDTAGLLDAVRAPLVAAGFVENAPPAAEPGLAAQATFSRGDGSELLVVGILDRD